MRNCAGDKETGEMLYFPFDPNLRRCPWSVLDPVAVAWIRKWHRWTDLGYLPYSSRVIDEEPIKVSEAFEACSRANRDMDRRAEREQQAEMSKIITQIGGPKRG